MTNTCSNGDKERCLLNCNGMKQKVCKQVKMISFKNPPNHACVIMLVTISVNFKKCAILFAITNKKHCDREQNRSLS